MMRGLQGQHLPKSTDMLESLLKDIAFYGEVEIYELHYVDSTQQQLSLLLGDDWIDDRLVLEEEDPSEDGEDSEDDMQPMGSHRAVDVAGEIFPLENTSSVEGLITNEPDHQ